MTPHIVLPLTYGIEEEFFWTETSNTKSKKPPFERWESKELPFSLGKEAHAAVVEVISPVCDSLQKLARHIRTSRDWLAAEAREDHAHAFAGGTHPVIDWQCEPMTALPYYQEVIADFGSVMRSNLIFGQHVHIGGMDNVTLIKTFNTLRSYLPIFCALAANSPYWRGEHTGIACYRQCIFTKMPRTGLPPAVHSLEENDQQAKLMLELGFIKSPAQFWYDARIHPYYKTIEVRVMDMQADPNMSTGIALFVAAVVGMIARGEPPLPYWDMPDWMIDINRWQAIKHGRNAMLINAKREKVSLASITEHLLAGAAQPLSFIDHDAYQAIKMHSQTSLSTTEVSHAV